MRYLMKQKLWSFTDNFTIKNESGEDCAVVVAKAFSLGDKLTFNDLQGNELAFISEKILSWGPTYEIHRGGMLAATLKKKLAFLREKFVIELADGSELALTGSMNEHEYLFERDGQPVAQVSKQWFTWSDTYGVDTGAEDPVTILAATIVVDEIHGHHR